LFGLTNTRALPSAPTQLIGFLEVFCGDKSQAASRSRRPSQQLLFNYRYKNGLPQKVKAVLLLFNCEIEK
jgi:hypothetical protein